MQSKINELFSRNKVYVSNSQTIYPACDYVLYFDGCCRGNPGASGIGAVIYKDKQIIWKGSEFIGTRTNNQSEYMALILGLKNGLELGIKRLTVRGDSQLVISQMNGKYKVNSSLLMALYEQTKILCKSFAEVTFSHVYRNENTFADALANNAVDKIIHLIENEKMNED